MDSGNGLNVGDVTGPRWAGGTRNPDDAERTWDEYSAVYAPAKLLSGRDWYARRATFMAGRASRDAEVATLREQLAAAEAVIEKAAEKYLDRDVFDAARSMYDILRSAPSSVLAAAKADAWDEGFKQGGPMHDEHLDDPDAHRRNPYRTGDTNA